MLHKLVAHFAEVIRPSSQALLHHRWNLLSTHVTLSWRDATQICQETIHFKPTYTYTYIYIYTYTYICASSKEGFP